MKADLKRQNFNVTPEQEAEISRLKEVTGAATTKDAILLAARVLGILAAERKRGRSIFLVDERGEKERLLIPELEGDFSEDWTYLVRRPHPWRRQLYIKGRKLPASIVCSDMEANGMTIEEAAENWSLPIPVVEECLRYCEQNEVLLAMEAEEEYAFLEAAGVDLGP